LDSIVKLSSLGDVIHSLIVLPKLDKKVDFLVDSSFAPILEDNPYINNIIKLRLREAKKNKSIFKEEFSKLKSMNYDNIYDLQGLFKSAITSKLAGKNIIGFSKPREYFAKLFYNQKIKVDKEYAIERYMGLFNFDDKEYLINHPKLLFYKDREFEYLSKSKKNIIFIIGATWECKKFPINKWIELANSIDGNIIVPYTKDEEKDAKELEKNANVTLVNINLNDLKALISKSDLLIGNDTGPSFIAWANNVNNIIIYGCTYNNKILENRYSKSVEVQKSITKGLMVMDKIDVKDILRKMDEF
jgi:heptosyltransferase-1